MKKVPNKYCPYPIPRKLTSKDSQPWPATWGGIQERCKAGELTSCSPQNHLRRVAGEQCENSTTKARNRAILEEHMEEGGNTLQQCSVANRSKSRPQQPPWTGSSNYHRGRHPKSWAIKSCAWLWHNIHLLAKEAFCVKLVSDCHFEITSWVILQPSIPHWQM